MVVVTPEAYACIAARRSVAGLPPIAKTDPAAIEAAQDPEIQRRAALLKQRIANAPTLTAEQIDKLRGLLPAPAHNGNEQR